jgi:hypothetical protein
MLKRTIFTSALALLLILVSQKVLSQGTCASPYNLGTIGTGSTCTSFSASGTTGSAPCAGAGYGGSGGVTYVQFCTGSTVKCINFSLTDGTTSGAWAVTVYSNNCSTVMDAQCLGNSGTGATYNTAAPTTPLQPNTCYTARLWNANGGSFSLCAQAMTPANDLCSGATAIGPTLLPSNNFCMTALSPGDPAPAAFCAGSLENNAWYTFTTSPTCVSPCTVVVTINNIVCSGGGSGFQVGYFTGSCGSLTNIGCTSGSGGTVTATITNLTPGQVVTIGIDGNAGANCTYGISASNTLPVPIELYDFKGTKTKDGVHLTWSTAAEINNDHFTIERSENAVDFYPINSVKGAGNSSKPINYSYDDHNPVNNVAYYRLKQTDHDGSYSYSRTIAVISVTDNKLSVAPNPANDAVVITYNCGSSSEEVMNVYDNKGNIVMSKKLICSEGLNRTSVDISELNPGMYMVFVSLGDKLYKTRLVKN